MSAFVYCEWNNLSVKLHRLWVIWILYIVGVLLFFVARMGGFRESR